MFCFFLFQCLFEIKKQKHTRRRAGGTQRLPAKQPSPWFCRGLEPFPFRVGFWTSRGGWQLEPVASGGGGCRAGGRRAGPRGSRAARLGMDAEKGWVDTGGWCWGGGGLMAREEVSGSQASGRHKEVRQVQSWLPGTHHYRAGGRVSEAQGGILSEVLKFNVHTL